MQTDRSVLSEEGRGDRQRQLSARAGLLRAAHETAQQVRHLTDLRQHPARPRVPCRRRRRRRTSRLQRRPLLDHHLIAFTHSITITSCNIHLFIHKSLTFSLKILTCCLISYFSYGIRLKTAEKNSSYKIWPTPPPPTTKGPFLSPPLSTTSTNRNIHASYNKVLLFSQKLLI